MKPNEQSAITRQHRLFTGQILFLLLILRIPYTIAIIYLLPVENQTGAAIYELASYGLIAFLIWWERERLTQFHLDTAALFCFLIFRPVQTLILYDWKVDSPLMFPRLLSTFIWLISAGLLIALMKSGYIPAPLMSRSLIWLAIGLCVGISFSILQNLGVVLGAFGNLSGLAANSSLLRSTGLTLLYHLGFAPINEEPLFRGFLWGYLRQRNWRESSIWLFQTFLFTLAHVYRANQDPILFWVFIPLAGLLLGWLTWNSRSLAPAILAHGLINGSAYVFLLMLIGWLRSFSIQYNPLACAW